jgi:hypothetical protein
MAKAVPTDVVKTIVGDYYKRAAPTPPAEKHSRRASREIWSEGRLIPSPIDQNSCAHWRNPMDMMRQG